MRIALMVTYLPRNVTSSPLQSCFITCSDSSNFATRSRRAKPDDLQFLIAVANGHSQGQAAMRQVIKRRDVLGDFDGLSNGRSNTEVFRRIVPVSGARRASSG